MKLLVAGHSLVIDANRKFWASFAFENKCEVDLIAPKNWSSNLSKELKFLKVESDTPLHAIYPLKTHLPGNGSVFFYNPFQLFKVLNNQKYDALYLNQETWAISTIVFILIKFFSINRHSPLYLCVAQNLKKDKLKFLHPYERIISRFVHAFLYCSEEVKEVLQWKGIQTKCIYFPLPYDDSSYKANLPSIGPVFKLGYLGRISEDKGIRVLLNAIEQIPQGQIKLILAGAGPLAQEAQSRNFVEYLGLIPHSKAFEFYQNIDCFILPSQTRKNWKEQFGRVIVESFAAGKPVIGSDSGSIPEVLTKLSWPWIFPEKSSIALAEKIQEIKNYLQTKEGKENLNRSIETNSTLFSQKEVAKKLYAEIFCKR